MSSPPTSEKRSARSPDRMRSASPTPSPRRVRGRSCEGSFAISRRAGPPPAIPPPSKTCRCWPRCAKRKIRPPQRQLRLQGFIELGSELRPFAFVFVLEENVGVLPRLRTNALHPGAQPRRVVVGSSQPQIPPVAGGYQRRLLVVCVRQAKRGARRLEHLVHVVGEPGRVPELEGGAAILRQLAQKISQPAEVLFEEGRHLEEDGPELRTQLPGGLPEEGDGVAGIVQLAPMGDALGRLEREDECLGDLLGPLGDHR